jgi:hypothetical protein
MAVSRARAREEVETADFGPPDDAYLHRIPRYADGREAETAGTTLGGLRAGRKRRNSGR